jgi:hypothetical protein
MSKLYVRLRASNEEVTTDYSTTNTTVTYPVTPTLTLGTRSLGPIVLTWNAPYAEFTSLEYSASDFSTITIELNTETYTFTTPGIYNIRVRASYNGSFTEYSNLIQEIIFPEPILSIKPRDVYNDLEAVWSPTPGFTYTVQYSLDSTFTNPTTLTNPILPKTSAPGTYYLKVKVKYGLLETDYSLPVSATIAAIPAAPTLSVSQISEYDSVGLEWTSTGPDFNTYSVEYATDIGFTQPTVVKVMGTRYDVILPTNVYYFRVRALYETDTTAYSSTITQNVLYRTKPDVPNLSITNRNDYEQVQLTWIAPTDTLFNQYVVEYATDASFTDAVVNTMITLNYQPTLSPGTYFFRMRVKHQSLNVYTAYRYINAIVLPMPDAPVLTIQVNEYSNIDVMWTNPHPWFNQYVLEYSLSPDFTNAVRVVSAKNDFSHLTELLSPGLYYFRVKAYYGTANTAFATGSTNIKKIPEAPDIMITTRNAYQPISLLYWSPDAVFNQYIVEYATNGLFTNAVVTSLTATTYQPTLLPGMYYFRIRAKHQSLNVYTDYRTTSATLSPLPSSIDLSVVQRLPNEPIVLNWNSGAVNYNVVTTGVDITTQNNTYMISNSTFDLPTLYVIEVTAYYGLGNTLPVIGIMSATAQKYYPGPISLSAITVPPGRYGEIIVRGTTTLTWFTIGTPNDATYDLYTEGVLSHSNVISPWHLSIEYTGLARSVRLKSIYGNRTSNTVIT